MILKRIKEKLDQTIEKYGLRSKEAYQMSLEVDVKIAQYYAGHKMKIWYDASLERYKEYIEQNGKEPSVYEWNKIAKQENCLSNESMHYIGDITFAMK